MTKTDRQLDRAENKLARKLAKERRLKVVRGVIANWEHFLLPNYPTSEADPPRWAAVRALGNLYVEVSSLTGGGK